MGLDYKYARETIDVHDERAIHQMVQQAIESVPPVTFPNHSSIPDYPRAISWVLNHWAEEAIEYSFADHAGYIEIVKRLNLMMLEEHG